MAVFVQTPFSSRFRLSIYKVDLTKEFLLKHASVFDIVEQIYLSIYMNCMEFVWSNAMQLKRVFLKRHKHDYK